MGHEGNYIQIAFCMILDLGSGENAGPAHEKSMCKDVVGHGFDVIEYSDERDIFHVEWDPK